MKYLPERIRALIKRLFSFSVFAAVIITFSVSCQSNCSEIDFQRTVRFGSSQLKLMLQTIDEIQKDGMKTDKQGRVLVSPRSLDENGDLFMVPSRDWCSGFFPGALWMMYQFTGDATWKSSAERFTHLLEQEKYNGGTHDMGFKMMCSYGNGYRLTANPAYRDILIQSAQTLITRYNPRVGCIRSWDHNTDKWQFPVIIDNMMNLELLFWASRETGDPVFADIAIKHARTTMQHHFRDDVSSYHVVDFDTLTGEVLHKHTHQGLGHESAWARGQAWGLYGYTMTYRETGNPEFIQQAEKIADYILKHPNLPADKVPLWDFDDPDAGTAPRDASAAAIIASALYELGGFMKDRKAEYHSAANQIMASLSSGYEAKPGSCHGFLLKHSTGSKPHNSEVDVPIIYADYYFLEALNRKNQISRN